MAPASVLSGIPEGWCYFVFPLTDNQNYIHLVNFEPPKQWKCLSARSFSARTIVSFVSARDHLASLSDDYVNFSISVMSGGGRKVWNVVDRLIDLDNLLLKLTVKDENGQAPLSKIEPYGGNFGTYDLFHLDDSQKSNGDPWHQTNEAIEFRSVKTECDDGANAVVPVPDQSVSPDRPELHSVELDENEEAFDDDSREDSQFSYSGLVGDSWGRDYEDDELDGDSSFGDRLQLSHKERNALYRLKERFHRSHERVNVDKTSNDKSQSRNETAIPLLESAAPPEPYEDLPNSSSTSSSHDTTHDIPESGACTNGDADMVDHDAPPSVSSKDETWSPSKKRRLNLRFDILCPLCLKTIPGNRKMTRHFEKFHSDAPLECTICPKSAKHKNHKGLFRHLMNSHVGVPPGEKKKPPTVQPVIDEADYVKCSQCPKSFPRKINLYLHVKRVHVFDRAKCDQCFKIFKNPASLRNHKYTMHRVEEEGMTWQCDQCPKSFTQIMAFKRHKRTHMVVERTTHPRGRRRDQTVPVEERTCPVCGKICLHKDSLSRHLKTHDDPSTVKCPVCPRTFSNRTQLNQHKQTHTGELECPLCGKVFKWKHSLTEHIRAHDGVRPYKCEHCESDFTDNRALKKHSLAAHGVETKGGIRKDLGLEIVKTANRRKVII